MNARCQRLAWGLSGCLLIAVCGCTGTATTISSASCGAPWLTTVPNANVRHPGPGMTQRDAIAVSPGQTLRIYGYWYETCHEPPASPFTDLTVHVTQGHSRQVLAEVSAHQPGGTFTIAVRLPSDLWPGPASVGTSQPVESPLYIQVR